MVFAAFLAAGAAFYTPFGTLRKILEKNDPLSHPDSNNIRSNKGFIPNHPISKEISTMKLAIRIFAAVVVLAGAAAITVPSSSSHVMPSSLAVSAAMPGPVCGPLCTPSSSKTAAIPATLR
jgi:hypothetical protein